jgi:hypothetical protein
MTRIKGYILSLAQKENPEGIRVCIPKGSKFLGISMETGVPTAFYEVDEKQKDSEFVIYRLIKTNYPVDGAGKMVYVGTVFAAFDTYHIFQDIPAKGEKKDDGTATS